MTDTPAPTPAQLTPAQGEKHKTLNDVIEETQTPTGCSKKKPKLGYRHFGRVMAWLVDPFTAPMNLINEGIKTLDIEDPPKNEADPETHLYWSFQALIKVAPSLQAAINDTEGTNVDAFIDINNQLKKARLSGHSDDTNKIKAAIGDILQVLNLIKPGNPPFPMATLKSTCGFVNDVSALLLTPALWQAHLNPNIIEEVRRMEHEITADDFPAFMYENNQCANPDDLKVGLCRGPLLVHVFRHLWLAPSAALNAEGTPKTCKKGNAVVYHVTTATPCSIAYAAIQTRFALSNATTWSDVDGTFDVQAFYWNTVELFTDGGDWAHEMLAWWNKTIFRSRAGHQPTAEGVQTASDKPAGSSISKIAQQRADKGCTVLAASVVNTA
ncbi:hypothetical protein EWM64_g1703 [Hericium alpestre]|uniref:Uncharacterized protein n=1 Tax=Hericium alpestre TaxID=135208 RepID=A0A4Z0A7N2_9AGAM|nr:hypothetical protein EWM64_g1703 [Hericium alpestre]